MGDHEVCTHRAYEESYKAMTVDASEMLCELVADIEDELFSTIQGEGGLSSDTERPWSNDFAFGFIFGARYLMQGKAFSGNAKYVLRRAFSECNAHYGDTVVLADITSRLIRQTLKSGLNG